MTIVDSMSVVEAAPDRLSDKFELWDEVPEGYREAAARIASSQALAEIVGSHILAEWVEVIPDFVRKQMFLAKIQDEVGHGHVMARVAEDLGVSREEILEDFVEGRRTLLNIFHYGIDSYEALGPVQLLLNSAAIVQFRALREGTYLPYTRALRKIETEESFHYHHALDLTHQTLTNGSEQQRQVVQDSFELWLPRMLAYFGPSDSETYQNNTLYRFGLKVKSNDDLRQDYLAKVIPVFQGLGVHVDPALARFDEETQRWLYAEPDWKEVKQVLRNGGPRVAEWKEKVRQGLERNRAYREVVSGTGR